MHVVKIGGSILKNKDDLNLIKQKLIDCHNCIIVTSALKHVTNMLIEAYETKNTGIIENIYNMHIETFTPSNDVKSKLLKFRDELFVLLNENESIGLRDHIISYGEKMSTVSIYGFLRDNSFSASYIIEPLIITDNIFGNASYIENKTYENIKYRNFGDITVVPGFYGATADGLITTVGRGGSDYTAIILGSLLNADVRIITDVPGIMSCDPKIFKNSRTIKEISIEEVLEMSHFGVKNFNYKTFTPAVGKNIDITIESLYEPGKTKITRNTLNSVKCVAITSYGTSESKNMLVFIGHGLSDPELNKDILKAIGQRLYHMDTLSISLLLDEEFIGSKKLLEEAPLWIK
ncbi:MAG: hypothetical protein QXZ44_00950 [Ferroplasma sp.]